MFFFIEKRFFSNYTSFSIKKRITFCIYDCNIYHISNFNIYYILNDKGRSLINELARLSREKYRECVVYSSSAR